MWSRCLELMAAWQEVTERASLAMAKWTELCFALNCRLYFFLRETLTLSYYVRFIMHFCRMLCVTFVSLGRKPSAAWCHQLFSIKATFATTELFPGTTQPSRPWLDEHINTIGWCKSNKLARRNRVAEPRTFCRRVSYAQSCWTQL